jgi:hypothetical protein
MFLKNEQVIEECRTCHPSKFSTIRDESRIFEKFHQLISDSTTVARPLKPIQPWFSSANKLHTNFYKTYR